MSLSESGPNYDKFQFIPTFVGELTAGHNLEFQGSCFKSTSFSLEKTNDGSLVLQLDLKESSSFLCSDFYLFAYHGEHHVEEYFISGTKKVNFKAPASDALKFDLENNGIRIFKFSNGIAKTLA